jgi:hypothetical protein
VDKEGERIDNFQKWMEEVNFSNTRTILIDDADAFVFNARQYADAIKLEHIGTDSRLITTTVT